MNKQKNEPAELFVAGVAVAFVGDDDVLEAGEGVAVEVFAGDVAVEVVFAGAAAGDVVFAGVAGAEGVDAFAADQSANKETDNFENDEEDTWCA